MASVTAVGLLTVSEFRTVHDRLDRFNIEAGRKGAYLFELHAALGYGGFIHRFKNFVLRQDPGLVPDIESDIRKMRAATASYEAVGVTATEATALAALRGVIDEYAAKLDIAEEAAAIGLAPVETDRRVRVNDAPALQAISVLESAFTDVHATTTRALSDSVEQSTATLRTGLIILPIFAIVAILIIWFLRRLLTEIAGRGRDVRESEERMRLVTDAVPGLISYIGRDLRYRFANRSCADWFGWEADKIIGRHVEEVCGKAVFERIAPQMAVALAGEDVRYEVELVRQDGARRDFHATYLPHRSADGEVAGFSTLVLDITERKQAELKLKQAHDDLDQRVHERTADLKQANTALEAEVTLRRRTEEALRLARDAADAANIAKSDFLASMSHELRTPLNSIIGFSDLLRGQLFGPIGNPKYIEYITDIGQSGIHLLQLINDILDLSKIEAGAMEITDEIIDIGAAVDACMTMVHDRDRGAIKLVAKVPDGFPALRGEELRVKQILINLLSNAVKFTPAGGEITIEAATDAAGAILLRVTDSGVGIAAQDIVRALRPFQQVGEKTDVSRQGTGLGLALANSLCKLHGGTLVIDSEPGEGTTATVRFPPERTVGGDG